MTSSMSYITKAIDNVEGLLLEDGNCEVLKSNARNLLPSNYRPQIDVTELLGPELLFWYFQLVGTLCWAIEIGRIDIFHETLLLLQHNDNTRVDCLEALYHIFAYLKIHIKMGCIGYDQMDPNIDFLVFNNSIY